PECGPIGPPGGQFGAALALGDSDFDGVADRLAVGAPGEMMNMFGQSRGRAYVFRIEPKLGLATLLTLTTPTGFDAAFSGAARTFPGRGPGPGSAPDGVLALAVGAPIDDSGHVYVYRTDTGALEKTINSPTPSASGRFGTFVEFDAASGLLVVAAPGEP